MTTSLKELAELTGSKIKGDENTQINNVAALQDATMGQISFVSNPKYKKYLSTSKASAVILSPELAGEYTGNVLINSNPYLTFARVVNALYKPDKPTAVLHPSAIISKEASIGEQVNIGANAVIEAGVKIGNGTVVGPGCVVGENSVLADDVLLHANVTLYSNTQIGSRSIIHSGSVIGADGFGFAPQKDKSWYKILQVGNVVIGSDVEIGANTTIDRAALGSTTIANGVKLDNLIQIGHNVQIDEHTIIAGCTGISGSTSIGKYCQIAGQVGLVGHLQIADNVVIKGKSLVSKSIKKPGIYSSSMPAEESKIWIRNVARFKQLDLMATRIKQLENCEKEK